MAIKHRQVQVTIYRKSQKYPYYQIAYRAEGGRIIPRFKTLMEAKNAARKALKQVAKGETAAGAEQPRRESLSVRHEKIGGVEPPT